MSAGARAWFGIAAFVTAWDALCPAEQLLTDTARGGTRWPPSSV